MFSTHLKNISQIRSLPQIGVKKNIWNHQLEKQLLNWSQLAWHPSNHRFKTLAEGVGARPQQRWQRTRMRTCKKQWWLQATSHAWKIRKKVCKKKLNKITTTLPVYIKCILTIIWNSKQTHQRLFHHVGHNDHKIANSCLNSPTSIEKLPWKAWCFMGHMVMLKEEMKKYS